MLRARHSSFLLCLSVCHLMLSVFLEGNVLFNSLNQQMFSVLVFLFRMENSRRAANAKFACKQKNAVCFYAFCFIRDALNMYYWCGRRSNALGSDGKRIILCVKNTLDFLFASTLQNSFVLCHRHGNQISSSMLLRPLSLLSPPFIVLEWFCVIV